MSLQCRVGISLPPYGLSEAKNLRFPALLEMRDACEKKIPISQILLDMADRLVL